MLWYNTNEGWRKTILHAVWVSCPMIAGILIKEMKHMKITIAGRKVTLKDAFKERVEKKLAKISRFFDDDAEAFITVTVEKSRQTVEMTIKNGSDIFRGEETATTMEVALDSVVDSLIRKIRKNKTKLEKKMRTGSFDVLPVLEVPVEEETEYRVVRNKKFQVKPMDIDEAILQMNLIGHSFFMFRNLNTNEINVVYCRADGDYGLLEPDVE